MKRNERELFEQIDSERLPRHVAIIMDGNGRWAAKRMLPRILGHRAGVKTVDRIVTLATEINLKALTLYSFSTENWKRPRKEIKALMGILKEFLLGEMMRMVKNNIRFNTIGHLGDLPSEALECIDKVKESTKNNDGTILTLALSYGSRNEIVDAVRSIAVKARDGKISPEEITEEILEKHLTTAGLPELDLLIRTSGELRISNFLLWEIAYAELYFCDALWPDFSNMDFLMAIKDYQSRERRFGLSGDQVPGPDEGTQPRSRRSMKAGQTAL
ncbi:MAG: isoprenyl transferase [bacterium]|nr:MAG: isoprenyl transferase [bacterium]